MTLYDSELTYDSDLTYDGFSSPVVGYTLGQLTDDTLRQLRGTTRDQINVLKTGIDAPAVGTVETLNLTGNLGGVTVGSLLAIGAETMYVLDADQELVTATVFRGYDDTTPTAASAGVVVNVDPPWPRSVVQARLKDEIRSWAPQLYAYFAVQIPVVLWQRGYDLGGIVNSIEDGGLNKGIIRILSVTAPQPPYVGAPGFWFVPGTTDYEQSNPSFPFRYVPAANPLEFPSGKAVVLTGGTLPTITGNILVAFATPFDVDTSWNENTDMIADVGMNSMDLDIPALGAAARLLRMMAVRRGMLNVEGQSREDQDVSMQAILQAAQQFESAAMSRRGDAQQRLLSDYPYRSSNY